MADAASVLNPDQKPAAPAANVVPGPGERVTRPTGIGSTSSAPAAGATQEPSQQAPQQAAGIGSALSGLSGISGWAAKFAQQNAQPIADKYQQMADQYRTALQGLGAEAKATGEEQESKINEQAAKTEAEYNQLGQAALNTFQGLAAQNQLMTDEQRAAYKQYQDQVNAALGKTTEQRLAESGAYAQGKAQEAAQTTATNAIKNAYRAAKTAGMLPGQAALAAAQDAGATFSSAFQDQLKKYDEMYQSADATRREEIAGQAEQALNAAIAGAEQGINIGTQGQAASQAVADSKAKMAMASVDQLSEAQKNSLDAQLDALLAQQTGDQNWAKLTLEEKIAQLQAKAAKDQNASNTLDKIISGAAGLLDIFI